MSVQPDPLYEALVGYEDSANNVGSLTVTTSGAYAQLTRAIAGYGDLAEARMRFELEAQLLADAHQQWAGHVQVLLAQVEDGIEWQRLFVIPRKHCAQCGAAWTAKNPWLHETACNECYADGVERAEHADHPDNVAADREIELRERTD